MSFPLQPLLELAMSGFIQNKSSLSVLRSIVTMTNAEFEQRITDVINLVITEIELVFF